MISLAGRDILHAWGKFVFTGIGLGLLIGVTLVMAGVYRGMVDDGKALLDNSGADLWVVQKDTLGPYAESSSLNDDVYRAILAMPGVAQAANVTYLTMQVRKGESDVRTMVVGIAPGALGATPGWPPYLVAGRQITRGHYEAVADIATGFKLGDRLALGLQGAWCRPAATRWYSFRSRMPKRLSSSRTTTPFGKAGVAPKPTRLSIDPVFQVCWMP